MTKVIIDKVTYPSMKKAFEEITEAVLCTDGSEQSRMVFAYMSLIEGKTNIDTYNEIAN